MKAGKVISVALLGTKIVLHLRENCTAFFVGIKTIVAYVKYDSPLYIISRHTFFHYGE